jgi:hypothetical protein
MVLAIILNSLSLASSLPLGALEQPAKEPWITASLQTCRIPQMYGQCHYAKNEKHERKQPRSQNVLNSREYGRACEFTKQILFTSRPLVPRGFFISR